jgi:hypothetical protein
MQIFRFICGLNSAETKHIPLSSSYVPEMQLTPVWPANCVSDAASLCDLETTLRRLTHWSHRRTRLQSPVIYSYSHRFIEFPIYHHILFPNNGAELETGFRVVSMRVECAMWLWENKIGWINESENEMAKKIFDSEAEWRVILVLYITINFLC